MYITVIPNRNSPPAILLREGYREGGKVKNRTLANLSHLPAETIEALKAALKGTPMGAEPEAESSLPHGHVLAVTGMIRKLGLDKLLHGKRNPMRELSLALIAGRILDPSSKLALAQSLALGAEHSTLGEVVGLGELGKAVDPENPGRSQEKRAAGELYAAMDWLLERQEKIENELAKRHLSSGCTVLYDLSSSYLEGRCCSMGKHGYSRDHGSGFALGPAAPPPCGRGPIRFANGRGDRPQINYGLLCNGEGVPVAIEVVEGNVGDPKTVPAQIQKLKERFHLDRVVVVGDRGMVTETRIREDISSAGYDWISALRHGSIQPMVEAKLITPSLFDERGIAEITHPDFPGERLIACFNPYLAEERGRKREELLRLTEAEVQKVSDACERKKHPLEGKQAIGLKAGAALARFKMAKYFRARVGDYSLAIVRNHELIAKEAALDGIYVIRTSVPKEVMDAEKAVWTYKELSKVERAFRTLKSVDLQVRPIYHYVEPRVKAHMFLCMLAYYVEFHLRKGWAELLYADEGGSVRATPVAPAEAGPSAKEKKKLAHNKEGLPLQSFHGLLKSLATLSKIRIRLGENGPLYTRTTKPTALQARAFKLIGVEVA